MYKKAFLSAVLTVTILSAAAVANAQTFVYPVGVIPSQATACVTFTAYQELGSSDVATGGQVSLLQQLLNREGYLSGVSGYFDNGTFGAVINYQRAHGIAPTGAVGPMTRTLFSQDSCNTSYGTSYGGSYGYVAPPANNSCSWINGAYQCGYSNNYPANCIYNSNGYYSNSSYYNNGCNGYVSLRINSMTSSYGNGGTTITVVGSGFSSSGNTVRFGNSTITNVYSYNGTSLTFTMPVGYYAGNYAVSVTNAAGMSSNSLNYIVSGNDYNNNNNSNNNCYSGYQNGYNQNYCQNNNNYPNVAPTVSDIGGSTNVPVNMTNTWTVTTSDQNNQNLTLVTNWGDSTGTDVQTSYGSGRHTYSLVHAYRYPGTYTIRATVTDSTGLSSYSTMIITVYDNGYNNYNQYNNNGYSYSYSY